MKRLSHIPAIITWLWLAITVASVGSARADTTEDVLVLTSVTVTGGNGNGQIDRHECNNLTLTLSNISASPIKGVSAVLTAKTKWVEITQPISAFTDFPAEGIASNTVPFQLGTANWFECGSSLELYLAVTSTNGVTNVVQIEQRTPENCQDGGKSCAKSLPVGGGILPGDFEQIGRLFSDNVSSTCAGPKSCPGLYTADGSPPRHSDAHTFTNCSGDTTCITVTLATTCSAGAAGIYSAAYSGYFDPSNLCQNYLADCGRKPGITPVTYSFTVPAGANFTVVVHEFGPDNPCGRYALVVSSEAGFLEYLPDLRLARQSGSVVLSWSTNAAGFRLESTPEILTSNFTVDTNTPGRLGEYFSLTNATQELQRMYRLVKPFFPDDDPR
ncbi:MAG: hypothetical protein HZA90_26955 [Verrucomicrobia bacterium]|nr:hypothetical protein [Verrucomicrobiota bacterium]